VIDRCSIVAAGRSQSNGTLTVLHALVVLHPGPQQTAHQALWDAWPDAKIEVRTVRAPEQTVIAGFLNVRDVPMGKRQLRLQRQQARQACPEAAMSGVAWHGLYHVLSQGEE